MNVLSHGRLTFEIVKIMETVVIIRHSHSEQLKQVSQRAPLMTAHIIQERSQLGRSSNFLWKELMYSVMLKALGDSLGGV